jgi:hypothetical protein
MQGYQLSNEFTSFLDGLTNLQKMIVLMTDPVEVAKVTSDSVDIFFNMVHKEAIATKTPPFVVSALSILEKGKQVLKVEDLIEFLEVMALMYHEPPMKEISIHILYSLENISSRHFPTIDFYLIVFPLLCQLNLNHLALEELESRPEKNDQYWNNRAALKRKLGLFKESLLCFDLALKMKPHPLYYTNKARVYDDLHQLPECLSTLGMATKLIEEEWFEKCQFDPVEAKTIIYMVYQNKLGALNEHYQAIRNESDESVLKPLRNELLECIAKLLPYAIGPEAKKLRETLEKLKIQLENNEANTELLLMPREKTLISCIECGKNDTYNEFLTPSFSCCSNCRTAVFCSKECQKKNWPNHKEFCKRAAFIFQHQQEKKQITKQNGVSVVGNPLESNNVIYQKQTKNE